jgi:hypothetical protein
MCKQLGQLIPNQEAMEAVVGLVEGTIMQSETNGFRDGLREYAWWKDGAQQVGSCGTTLKQAMAKEEERFKSQRDELRDLG